MSDRGIPAAYRHKHDFGSHTFCFVNANNERHSVKFHFRPEQGIQNPTGAEAEAIVGKDRESNQRDLYENIENRDFPHWTLGEQIMPETDAAKTPCNPFDLTKGWSHKDNPLIEVGVMELNRNPENLFAGVEQSAFDPANVVPGIGFSLDDMLRGVSFLTATRSVTDLESITNRFRQMRRAVLCTTTVASVRCVPTGTMEAL